MSDRNPPTPTAAQMRRAGSKYHLRSYGDGGAGLLRMLRDLFGSNDPDAVDALDPAIVHMLRRGLYQRSAPPAPTAFYPGISHQQLYTSVTESVDPGQLGDMAAAWSNSSEKLLDASQSNASKALAASEMTWQGKAGETARASVAKLANAAGQLGQASQVSAQLYQQQSIALAQAKNSVPKPPAQPFDAVSAAQRLATVTDPVRFMALAQRDQAQFVAQQQAHQQAARIVQQYDQVVTQTSRSQPAYAPAPQVAKPASRSTTAASVTPSAIGSPQGHGIVAPNMNAGSGGIPSVPTRSDRTGSTNARSIGAPSMSVPSQTTPSAFAPSGGLLPNPTGNSQGGGSSNPFGAAPNPFPNPGHGSDVIVPVTGGAGTGATNGRDGGVTGGGARSGAGATAAEEAPVEHGATSVKGATEPGEGMMPATRAGKGGEDTEHKRASYLTEPDPNEIFGVAEKTVPPVIG